MMTLRYMRFGEGKKLAGLLHRSVHTLCREAYTPEELEAWAPSNMDMMKFNASLRKSVNWVAEEGGRIIGFICVERDGYVNRLYTHPDHVNRGIATALLDAAIAWAKKHKLKRIFLAASKVGYGFYVKKGFQVCGIERVERRGITFENKIMEKFI